MRHCHICLELYNIYIYNLQHLQDFAIISIFKSDKDKGNEKDFVYNVVIEQPMAFGSPNCKQQVLKWCNVLQCAKNNINFCIMYTFLTAYTCIEILNDKLFLQISKGLC